MKANKLAIFILFIALCLSSMAAFAGEQKADAPFNGILLAGKLGTKGKKESPRSSLGGKQDRIQKSEINDSDSVEESAPPNVEEEISLQSETETPVPEEIVETASEEDGEEEDPEVSLLEEEPPSFEKEITDESSETDDEEAENTEAQQEDEPTSLEEPTDMDFSDEEEEDTALQTEEEESAPEETIASDSDDEDEAEEQPDLEEQIALPSPDKDGEEEEIIPDSDEEAEDDNTEQEPENEKPSIEERMNQARNVPVENHTSTPPQSEEADIPPAREDMSMEDYLDAIDFSRIERQYEKILDYLECMIARNRPASQEELAGFNLLNNELLLSIAPEIDRQIEALQLYNEKKARLEKEIDVRIQPYINKLLNLGEEAVDKKICPPLKERMPEKLNR